MIRTWKNYFYELLYELLKTLPIHLSTIIWCLPLPYCDYILDDGLVYQRHTHMECHYYAEKFIFYHGHCHEDVFNFMCSITECTLSMNLGSTITGFLITILGGSSGWM